MLTLAFAKINRKHRTRPTWMPHCVPLPNIPPSRQTNTNHFEKKKELKAGNLELALDTQSQHITYGAEAKTDTTVDNSTYFLLHTS